MPGRVRRAARLCTACSVARAAPAPP